MTEPIRLLIADDDALVAAGLTAGLRGRCDPAALSAVELANLEA